MGKKDKISVIFFFQIREEGGGGGLEGLESRLIILQPSSPKLDSITLLCTLRTNILAIFCLFPLVKICKFQAVLSRSLATMYTKITAAAESVQEPNQFLLRQSRLSSLFCSVTVLLPFYFRVSCVFRWFESLISKLIQ